ncbi:uncharacterized protein LOC118263295 isoform X2 [Spodoptera frugiperda]|uniref:Uncharacterized protein LOC118263295 isoform X2 n=1 Tax=Spodoptera frugiperda TaxID=7108 RepID=A0A9R0F5S2_SPOFR|nr:uncharacterized protein LOC118263295 isoform X2 [Spodoptera frugiperda]
MMEHVRIFDWCSSAQDRYFVEEADLDNCNTEKILRNKFIDPLVSSDSEDEAPNKIDWDEVFRDKKTHNGRMHVPCLRAVPQYPKLSKLASNKHHQMLKVLCTENPHVLGDCFIGKASRQDFKAFETEKETYLAEQKEYKDWAKTIWTTNHFIRALRPKPLVEAVYEAEFKMKALRMRGLPKQYDLAAQIALESPRSNCDVILKQELIGVAPSEVPLIQIPKEITKAINIITPCTVPEPCQKHPYQIILPHENTISMLPTTEVHKELATFAWTNGTQYIASENALKCLVQWNRYWTIPLSVCESISPDGEKANVVVLDSEFSINKEVAPIRTYKAFRHLLESTLIPLAEKEKVRKNYTNKEKPKEVGSKFHVNAKSIFESSDLTSDEEEENLVIDTGEDTDFGSPKPKSSKRLKTEESVRRSARLMSNESIGYNTRAASRRVSEECQDIGVYSCTCKDTIYEKPPRRSYKKWQFRNKLDNEKLDIIVHCPHKARDGSRELIFEPSPEYQLDLGASEQSMDSLRSIALSLALRKNAAVVNVRVDGSGGDVATIDVLPAEKFTKKHPDMTRQVITAVHTALSQLQGLLPGHYVLLHEPSHGANSMLLSSRSGRGARLLLQFDSSQLAEADEAQMVRNPPVISDALLPYHKFRKILPCAFTPHENQLAKEVKKPATKKKAPPQALKLQAEQPDSEASPKWPKRRTRRKKK